MLASRVDDAARVCRLQSLWCEAASRPVNESTIAMRGVLEGLCAELNATDGSWLVMRRNSAHEPKVSGEKFSDVGFYPYARGIHLLNQQISCIGNDEFCGIFVIGVTL